MNELAKQMAPIRDSIARTLATIHEVERLLITATEAEAMEFTSAAEGAVEQARRLLAELSGNTGELPKTLEEANSWLTANAEKVDAYARANCVRLVGAATLKPGHDHDDADPYMTVQSPAPEDINRVLAELAGRVIATKGRAVTHTKVLYDDDNGLWFAGGMMQWSPTTNRNDLAEVLAKLTDGQWELVERRLLPVKYQSDFEGGFIHWTHICDPRIIAQAVAEVVK